MQNKIEIINDDMVDMLCQYRDYVSAQTNSDYINGLDKGLEYVDKICVFVLPALEIACNTFPVLAIVFEPHQMLIISGASDAIFKGISEGMKNKMFYKDIYKDVKSRVFAYAELTGQSNVIGDCLKLTFKGEKQ